MRDGAKAREGHEGAGSRRRGAARAGGGTGHGPPRRPAQRGPARQGAAAPPGPRGRLARALGLAATLLLLGVGVAVVILVTRDRGDSERQSVAVSPTATATAARRRAAGPPGPRLTNAQRASRDAAVAQLRRQGFEPVAIETYKPRQALRVLIGRPKASTGVRGRRAFFFLREQYIGTDAAEPSGRLRVVARRRGQITLAYGLFAAGDKACCPTAGTVRVRFAMGDGRLQPLDAIPVAASRMPAS